jgi:hypothetical protein
MIMNPPPIPGEPDSGGVPPPRRRPGRRTRIHHRRHEAWAVAVVGGLAGMFLHAHPTGHGFADAVWSGLFVGLVSLAASKSRRTPWIWMTALVVIGAAGSNWVWIAVLSLGLAVWASFADHRSRPFGAVVGAIAALALLHQPVFGFHGAPTALAVLAVAPVVVSALERCDRRQRWIILVTTAGVVLILAILSTGALIAGLAARSNAQKAVGFSRSAISATHAGDQATASDEFGKAAESFRSARRSLDVGWSAPAGWIPIVGPNIRALKGATAAGEEVAASAQAVGTSAPYESLRLVDGQIDLASIAPMRRPVTDALNALHDAQATLARIDSSWLLSPVARPVHEFIGELDGLTPQVEAASVGLDVLPAMMGSDRPQHYLVQFTSPAESRFLGGFVGAYGVLTAEKGKLTLTSTGSSDSLNRILGPQLDYVPPPDYLARYSRYKPKIFSQNWTASPNLPTDADVDRQLFQQATGVTIDGVIVADVYGLAALLQLTGPVNVPGFPGPLDSQGAVKYLLRDQYVLYSDDLATNVDARRERLIDVAKATFDALTSTSLPGLRPLADVLGAAVTQGHLMFSTYAIGSSDFLGRLGLTGEFSPPEGSDFVSLRTANANPSKIDVYLQRSLSYEVQVDPTSGLVKAVATITLTNSAPASGLPAYVIGNEHGKPSGSNTTYLSLYSPLALVGATQDGTGVGMEVQREFDNPVYSRTVTVLAGQTVQVRLELQGIEREIARSHQYDLEVLNQPMVNPDQIRIAVHSTRSGHPATGITGPTGSALSEDRIGTFEGIVDQNRSVAVHFG